MNSFSQQERSLLLLVVIVMIISHGNEVSPEKTNEKYYLHHQSRMNGGRLVNIKNYPYQAALFAKEKFICDGSIVSPKHILTSAHCVEWFPGTWFLIVKIGSSLLNKGKEYSVKAIYEHPDHHDSLNRYDHDIALVELNEKIIYSKTVRPINVFNVNDTFLNHGTVAVTTGFGYAGRKATGIPNQLMATEVSIISRKKCQLKYKHLPITQNMLCGDSYSTGICKGDSGGPLVLDGVQIAVASYRLDCGNSRWPGIYISTHAHEEFIKSIIYE